jgi:hypothetical protein
MNIFHKFNLNYINLLPDAIISIIYEYIPTYITIFLTKKDYLLNHIHIGNFIPIQQKENYIRTILRQDNKFVFNLLLIENTQNWINIKKYYYKNYIYNNYLFFLKAYCIDNESYNCLDCLQLLIEELGLSKNQHKKNHYKYIRWKI